MNLNFISPLYLLGLLGILLPILVHLLTRRHRTRIKFSAVYLLLQSQKRFIKRSKPNRLLLLLVRCLAIACLSLALANPIFSFGVSDDFLPSMSAANVFILDDSYSMGIRAEDETLYAEAVEVLANTFKNVSSNSSYSLVLASAPGRVIHDWVADPGVLLKMLKISKPSYRTTDIGNALSEALALLETAPQKTKRIFILTDRDKNGWNKEHFPQRESYGQPISIKVIDFSERQTGENRASIKNVEITQEFLTNSRIIRVKTVVANLQPEKAIRNLHLALWVNGKRQSESFLDLPANGSVEKEFSFPYLGNEPVHGFVEIAEDALTADNRRYFNYQPDRRIRVLVVDGDPKMVAHQNEAFYLERALNPFYGSFSDIEPTVSTLTELPSRNLLLFSAIILCNVRDLPFQYEFELEKFVLRGGALFISLGDQVDPKFYNEKMGNLLPVKIESLNRAPEPDKPFRLLMPPSEHPVLKVFDAKMRKEMENIRFNSIYSILARENSNFEIPMRFSNQFPAVIESQFGKGKVILYVSSIDRDWNNFPIQPTFLPWIQRWIKYSVHSLESMTRQDLLAGQPFVFDRELAASVYVQTPAGKIVPMDMGEAAEETRFEHTFRPGVYHVFQAPFDDSAAKPGDSVTPQSEKVFWLPAGAEKMGSFTVNVDTRESISEKISIEEIQEMLPGTTTVVTADFASQESDSGVQGTPLTTPFLLLVALALFCEGWQVRRE